MWVHFQYLHFQWYKKGSIWTRFSICTFVSRIQNPFKIHLGECWNSFPCTLAHLGDYVWIPWLSCSSFHFSCFNLVCKPKFIVGHKYTSRSPRLFFLCEVLYHIKNENCEGIKFYKKLKLNTYLKKFNLLVDFSKKFNVHTLRT
jgi:hypothetical protein